LVRPSSPGTLSLGGLAILRLLLTDSGIVWGEELFRKYIQNPQGIVPGTKTIFPGIKNEQQVNDLCAYVSQFNAVGTKK
jgi:cytochrome c2